MTVLSLREHRKATTRKRLVDVADRLFREKGYDATMLDEVSAEAGVSIRTLLRYFGSKDQLALEWYRTALDEFRDGLASRHPDTDALSFWRSHVATYARREAKDPHYLERVRITQQVPALTAQALAITREYEDLLTKAFAEEAGADPETDLHSRLLAGMLVAGNGAANRRWIASGGADDLEALCLAVVDFAIQRFPARHAPALAQMPI